nr:hypothetical protein CFP56_03823 [Quercus suber]
MLGEQMTGAIYTYEGFQGGSRLSDRVSRKPPLPWKRLPSFTVTIPPSVGFDALRDPDETTSASVRKREANFAISHCCDEVERYAGRSILDNNVDRVVQFTT